jgi:hypothetical protein
MQAVTYSDGQFHMLGMDIEKEDMDAVVDETLENLDEVSARHGLDTQQTAQLSTWLMAYRTGTPEQQAEILGRIAEAHPEIAREMGKSALQRQEQRTQNEMTHEERQDAVASTTLPDEDWEAEQSEFAEAIGYDEAEAVEFGERALEIGNGTSMVGSTDLARSFEAGFNAAPEFNAQAAGDVQFAQAAPAQRAPIISGPGLAQG